MAIQGGAGSKRVLLVSNTAWYLYNFRLPLARLLRDRGWEPVLVSPRDDYARRIEAEGFRWVEWGLQRRSLNPFRELMALRLLWRIYRQEAPWLAHHFTIKCVLYGSLAAAASRVPFTVNSITGLGHVFLDPGWKRYLLRPAVGALYRWALNRGEARVIFQNRDDLNAFVERGLVLQNRTRLVRSSGVDLERFKPGARAPTAAPPLVLFASRLLREKGIGELIEAFRHLRAQGVTARLRLAGAPDPANPSSISEEDLRSWREELGIETPGHVDSVEAEIAQAEIVVLPSYREGVPRILLEAAAMERAIVATDVPGCREVVEDGVTGLLVPAHDSRRLAAALERLLGDEELRARLGRAARVKVVEEFSDLQIAEQTWRVYQEMRFTARS